MKSLRSALGEVLVVVLSGCSADDSGGAGGSCPLALERDGDTYYALKTEKRVQGDGPLGSVGFSACTTDADDKAEQEDAQARFAAEVLEGIDPAVAFAVPSRWPRHVFYSGPSDASSFPPEVERLLNR